MTVFCSLQLIVAEQSAAIIDLGRCFFLENAVLFQIPF
jgi:hypothetical protein